MLLSDVIDHTLRTLFVNEFRLLDVFSDEEGKDFRNLLSTSLKERIPEF